MTFFSQCATCNKRKFVIKKRTYKIKEISVPIMSQGELCYNCYKKIKKILRQ